MSEIKYEVYTFDEPNIPYIITINQLGENYDKRETFLSWHENLEIIHILSGTANVISDGESITSCTNETVIINTDTLHKIIAASNNLSYMSIVVENEFLSGIFHTDINSLWFNEHVPEEQLVSDIINRIINENKNKHLLYDSVIKSLIIELLVTLFRQHVTYRSVKESSNKMIRQKDTLINALIYIRENFTKDISIDELSSLSGLSRSHFCTSFKELTSMTAINYINTLRCKYAKSLLMTKKYTISEVSYMCGFNNISYFNKTFKKHYGITPSKLYESTDTIKNKYSFIKTENKFGQWPEKIDKPYYKSKVGTTFATWWTEPTSPTHEHWYAKNFNRLKPVEYDYYSCGDPEYLANVFERMKNIGIDFVLLDDNNPHWNDFGYIARNINICFETARSMKNNAPKLAILTGHPLIEGKMDVLQYSIDMYYYDYVSKFPETYYNWKDKPLLVLNVAREIDKIGSYYDDRFTIRYGTGLVRQQKFIKDLETEKQEFVMSILSQTGNWARVFDAPNPNPEIIGVNPGYSKVHSGIDGYYIPRENGKTYMNMWLEAIKSNREVILIGSYNIHPEETGWEAVKPIRKISTDNDDPCKDPFLYEKITEAYLALRYGFIEGFKYREESSTEVYLYCENKLVKHSSNDNDLVIVIPDGYFDWKSKH